MTFALRPRNLQARFSLEDIMQKLINVEYSYNKFNE